MKTYYVLWTFAANYSKLMEIPAESAEEAKNAVLWLWGKEFRDTCNMYVFDTPPVIKMERGSKKFVML